MSCYKVDEKKFETYVLVNKKEAHLTFFIKKLFSGKNRMYFSSREGNDCIIFDLRNCPEKLDYFTSKIFYIEIFKTDKKNVFFSNCVGTIKDCFVPFKEERKPLFLE